VPTITCPQCRAVFAAPAGKAVACPECGVRLKTRAPEPVAFPEAAREETMLDLSEAIKAVRRKMKKKE